jgi:L,D-peptidoglycan transpeptidase YkuD (ErfK/YbiS/YcfS/YnhG family)
LRYKKIALCFLAVYLTGCKPPPVPPEAEKASVQEHLVWKAGASHYAPREYETYVEDLKLARQALVKENLKLGWFRRYRLLRDRFQKTIDSGDAILAGIRTEKEERARRISVETAALQKRLTTFNEITLSLNERGRARQCLSRAEVMLEEAGLMSGQAKYNEADAKIRSVKGVIKEAEDVCLMLLTRYMDQNQIDSWRRMAEETVAESRAKGITAIVVSKLEKRMVIYKKGSAFAEYDVGLGFNGLSDKLHSGDDATPEGRYQITKKNSSSRFYKALLINYPNEEDKRRFAAAKQKREIPYWVGIGGLVEIHGGGEDSLTEGCISVDDKAMDELFSIVLIGTPVTIVGTLDREGSIFKAIKDE